MKELQTLLKLMSDGLKTLAQGVETLADRVDKIAKTQTADGPEGKTVKKTARKTTRQREVKRMTAADTVLNLIGRSKKGIDNTAIMAKTGYDRKRVANIIYKLGKQGKIKSIQRGVYLKSDY
jgi:DNA replicative helicase MCM subunit Mcm2 (Cdc46/Mcm family)